MYPIFIMKVCCVSSAVRIVAHSPTRRDTPKLEWEVVFNTEAQSMLVESVSLCLRASVL
ncbi:hypothetical protein EZS27_014815 [termite gut metagenome]|uniref:Uncharacterized protein n=1 Tax=termite gut metagenome TaxID=433724 RepID=A0A5J4RVV3_9ZZZZ